MLTPHRQHVLLVVSARGETGRGCLRGISRYVRAHDAWDCLHLDPDVAEPLPGWVRHAKLDGVIVRCEAEPLLDALLELGLPTVDLRARRSRPGVASFAFDPAGLARLAAADFIARGFRRFAYCGRPGDDVSDARSRAFAARLREEGYDLRVFPGGPGGEGGEAGGSDPLRTEAIGRWLVGLPKPTGLLCCDDERARQVLRACAAHAVRVPTGVAVMGVGDDELVCDFARPTLSSIDPDAEALGYAGAAALDARFEGKPAPDRVVLVPPRGVVTRGSSEGRAIADPLLAEAIVVIREQAASGLNVAELTDKLAVGRTTLERRFQAYLGCSPRDEIIRHRLDRVCRLLADTDHPVATIARMCGFKTSPHLSVVFRRQFGTTPGEYRARSRESA